MNVLFPAIERKQYIFIPVFGHRCRKLNSLANINYTLNFPGVVDAGFENAVPQCRRSGQVRPRLQRDHPGRGSAGILSITHLKGRRSDIELLEPRIEGLRWSSYDEFDGSIRKSLYRFSKNRF